MFWCWKNRFILSCKILKFLVIKTLDHLNWILIRIDLICWDLDMVRIRKTAFFHICAKSAKDRWFTVSTGTFNVCRSIVLKHKLLSDITVVLSHFSESETLTFSWTSQIFVTACQRAYEQKSLKYPAFGCWESRNFLILFILRWLFDKKKLLRWSEVF